MVMSDAEARRESLDFAVDHDLEVTTDRQLLTSAVSNLVQNGVRYTCTGGHVHVRATKRDDGLAIEVEDECGGLPPGAASDMFEPFVRGTTESPGMGLGLSIVTRASRTLGGDVHVRNLPGKGCVFTIDLPNAHMTTNAQ
jgi:signal transduction histidine kinase